MKTLLTFGFAAPLAEIALGWAWLAGGHGVAGRLLTFYWWLTVAVLLGLPALLVVIRMLSGKSIPPVAPSSRVARIWTRSIFFARVVVMVAIGCTSLAVFSLTAWCFCRLALLIVTETADNPAGA
ncbi:hypothetical protein [Paraburkholderia tropica]|uniref:hypothetical protein n=1 Tax=Paraburkholderia tropica TaxID=92647 RepID=UPI002AB7B1AE|nr:hypothetical protein [Paraburkholderia tropica]